MTIKAFKHLKHGDWNLGTFDEDNTLTSVLGPLKRREKIPSSDEIKVSNVYFHSAVPTVTGETFGIVGDGVTDNTAALNEAIDYLNNNNVSLLLTGDILTLGTVDFSGGSGTNVREIQIAGSVTVGETWNLPGYITLVNAFGGTSDFAGTVSFTGQDGIVPITITGSIVTIDGLRVEATNESAIVIDSTNTVTIKNFRANSNGGVTIDIIGSFWVSMHHGSVLRSSYDGTAAIRITDKVGRFNSYLIRGDNLRIFRGPIQFSSNGGTSSYRVRDISFEHCDWEQMTGPLVVVDADEQVDNFVLNNISNFDAQARNLIEVNGIVQDLTVKDSLLQFSEGIKSSASTGYIINFNCYSNNRNYGTAIVEPTVAQNIYYIGRGSQRGYKGQMCGIPIAPRENLAQHSLTNPDASGITAPDGSTTALQYTTPISKSFVAQDISITTGDWIVGGCWVQTVADKAAGGVNFQVTQVNFEQLGSSNIQCADQGFYEKNIPGAWKFVSGGDKVKSIDATPNELRLQVVIDTDEGYNVWEKGAVVYHLPGSEYSDEEALRILEQLQSHSPNVGDSVRPPGTCSTLDHQSLSVGDGSWDGGHLIIGRDQHIWRHADDYLRWKPSNPTSDDDGYVLGFIQFKATNDLAIHLNSANLHLNGGIYLSAGNSTSRDHGVYIGGGAINLKYQGAAVLSVDNDNRVITSLQQTNVSDVSTTTQAIAAVNTILGQLQAWGIQKTATEA